MSWNNTVTCSHCRNTGHNRAGCAKLEEQMRADLESTDSWCRRRAKKLRAWGATVQEDSSLLTYLFFFRSS